MIFLVHVLVVGELLCRGPVSLEVSFSTCSSAVMRAAVYQAFSGHIQVQNLPRPSAPVGGVVLQVKATGVCRSDWHGWKGHDSDIIDHGLPFVPGHELSGVVVEVGEGTCSFRVRQCAYI